MELQDITTAIKDNQDLTNGIIDHLKGNGYAIRTTEEDNTFKQNAINHGAETLFNDKIGDKLKELHNQYDQDVFNVTGIQRNQDEKSYDYNKRVHETNLARIKQLEASNKELDSRLKSGDVDSVWKSKYETIESEAKQRLLEKDNEIQKLKGTTERFTKSQEINKIYTPIKSTFKKDLPGYFKTTEEHILNDVISKAKQKNGEWIMTKDGENELLDTNLNEIKIEDFLKKQFKDAIEEKRTQNGIGTGHGSTKSDGGTSNVVVPGEIKTISKLIDYLLEIGLERGSKEWHEAYKKGLEENKIIEVI